MDEYLRLIGASWVVDGSGKSRYYAAGDVSTLRADFLASLGSQVQLIGGAAVELSPRDAANLDLSDEANWTAAVAGGFRVTPREGARIEVVATWDGAGSGTSRTVRIHGAPVLDLVLTVGQIRWSGRLGPERFPEPIRVEFVDSHVGVSVVAVRHAG